ASATSSKTSLSSRLSPTMRAIAERTGARTSRRSSDAGAGVRAAIGGILREPSSRKRARAVMRGVLQTGTYGGSRSEFFASGRGEPARDVADVRANVRRRPGVGRDAGSHGLGDEGGSA